ncbi:MAG: hypothetical protein V3T33_01290 [Myxococcota bacterium]
MLFLHETHELLGAREGEFEAAFRDEWMPALARGDDARLLYFLHHTHGTGVSYNVVTITALRDGGAWQALGQRVHEGDLRAWVERVDQLRRDVRAKLLLPLAWSPLQQVEFESLPTRPEAHELSLFMEDTVWPYHARLEDYIEAAGSHYAREIAERGADRRALLEIQAGFRTAFGSHLRREVVLWQKVVQPKGMVSLLTREVPEEYKKPGTWMHDALELRDRWESRLLRTAAWSPLF